MLQLGQLRAPGASTGRRHSRRYRFWAIPPRVNASLRAFRPVSSALGRDHRHPRRLRIAAFGGAGHSCPPWRDLCRDLRNAAAPGPCAVETRRQPPGPLAGGRSSRLARALTAAGAIRGLPSETVKANLFFKLALACGVLAAGIKSAA